MYKISTGEFNCRRSSRQEPWRELASLKIALMNSGVSPLTGEQAPNSDHTGHYIVIRDEISKISAPVYVPVSESGFDFSGRRRRATPHEGHEFVVELERPYQCFGLTFEECRFRDICNIEYDGHVSITANHGCMYIRDGTACKFCSIPEWRDSADKSISRLGLALQAAIDLGEVKHVSFTTGTTPTSDRGIRAILRLISRLSNRSDLRQFPIFAEFEPPEDLGEIERLAETGVTTVSCNLEFLNENERLELMPGKGMISLDKYARCWEKCVSIFGKGQVFSNILLSNRHAPVTDTISGSAIDWMIDMGVVPSPGPLYSDPNSELGNINRISSVEHLTAVTTIAQRLVEADLNPRLAMAGCHRNGSYSAINECYMAQQQT